MEKKRLLATAQSGNLSTTISGKWKFTFSDTESLVVEFFSNHTWVVKKSTSGKWKIEDNKILMIYPDGGTQVIFLPLNPSGTRSHNAQGRPCTVTFVGP